MLQRAGLLITLLLAVVSLAWMNSLPGDSELLDGVIENSAGNGIPRKDKLQSDCHLRVIYVQVDRNKGRSPSLTYHTFGLAQKEYFYPASLVKLPLTFLSFELVNELRKNAVPWLDIHTPMEIIAAEPCQTSMKTDPSTKDGSPRLSHFMRKILVASDNPSYNRLYDFLGQGLIRDKLMEKGYKRTRIPIRFSDCDKEQNRYAPYIRFTDPKTGKIHHLPARMNRDTSHLYAKGRKAGKAYVENNRTFWKPKDFSNSNELPLEEVLDMLIRFAIPDAISTQEWNLTANDRAFLWQYLSTTPKNSGISEYADTVKFPRHLKKYFLHDAHPKLKWSESLKIFNIVGLSYGFASDVSYVVDLENGVEFFLAATVIANENGIIGDGRYEYEKLAFPLFGRMFNRIYEIEKNRKRESKYQFEEIRTALAKPLM